jgi:NAD(P)-dependent dehydrogenase (short-subunit alcohol dehydrogenase family)
VAAQLRGAGADVFPIDLANGVDLADREALEAIVHPLGHLDAVFYLAGKAVTGHLLDPDACDKVDTVLESNLRGVINLASLTAPALRASRGRFVCANSVFSMLTARGFGAYSISKAALSAAMAALRPELAPATVTDCVLGGVRTSIFETAAKLDVAGHDVVVSELR